MPICPVATLQGLEPHELVSRVGARDVYVWGSGDVAQDVLASLKGASISVRALMHTEAGTAVERMYGLQVYAATEVLDRSRGSERPFIVIATGQYRLQAEATCLAYGLQKNSDFLDYLSIRRPVGVIEVAYRNGTESVAMMPLDSFKEVLKKMRSDQQSLCHVELAWLGDPALNPELPGIVAHCEQFVPCTVATTLDMPMEIEALLAAGPSRFNVVVRGYGDSFVQGGKSCSWSAFLDNLQRLKSAIPAGQGRTRFTLKYRRTRDEPAHNMILWKKLLGDANISLAVEWPYLFPYDQFLAYCEHASLPHQLETLINNLPWNIDVAIDLARLDRERACLSQRLFPVVGSDLSVGGCHLYKDASLASAYLDTPWGELLRLRRESMQCERCQIHGLHRLDLPILLKRFPEEKSRLFPPD